jgi:hypothetical protein
MKSSASSVNWKRILKWLLLALALFFVIGRAIGIVLASFGMDIHFNW